MDKIIVLDFGSQYSHLISRRIRDLGVYSQVLPSTAKIKEAKGIILSGGAKSVYQKNPPKFNKEIFKLDIPVLGICYGHQLIAFKSKGKVVCAKEGEYGITDIKTQKSDLLKGLNKKEKVWMNHKDIVEKLPKDFKVTASSKSSKAAAFENKAKKLYGVQFHPEVTHTKKGNLILKNFVFNICKAKRNYKSEEIIENEIEETLKDKKVVMGLSGGIDSSVAAILVNKAIKKNLKAVFVDTGLLRENEAEDFKKTFKKFNLNLKVVNARARFFKALKGVEDPEKKRKTIGKLFIDIFEEEAKKHKADILIQGTIYSDRIESGVTKHSSNIKSHHNVGGLPKNMRLKVYEPLRNLYKDEVRKLAKKIGIDEELIKRHVFPGPGLAIRIIGEVTREKADIVRKASYIIDQELKKENLYYKVWMGFAVLLSIKSVGIQGDSRSYKYPIVLRIIESKDAMTANFAKVNYRILENISTRITNEIKQVNRVVYDISNKPPATMEWE